MRDVHPEVFLIARPKVDWGEVRRYLEAVGGLDWYERVDALDPSDYPDAEGLVEFMGRLCYRSWVPELNPNVKKVREDSGVYLVNILRSLHGSVIEHANFTFVFHNVSRVFTHELVRHRAGVAISQESMRFVRLTDLPFEHPEVIAADPELLADANDLLAASERFQLKAAQRLGLDEEGVDFAIKKAATSSMRRYAPDGVATCIGWTCNIRALRHTITMRTAPGAEDEIRRVFDEVAKIMKVELPNLLSDFTRDENGTWTPEFLKV